jgi:LacI family transcriptional regulator
MPRAPRRPSAVLQTVTIRDVAAKAGVSVATVSRVFNRKGPIREDTFERVTAIAAEMRYVPDAAARSLSTRSTSTIGVVLPDLHGEFFSEVIRGIDLAARHSGYHLIVSGSHSNSEEMRAVLRAVRGRVDGLIVMSPDLEPSAMLADFPSSFPLVLLNSRVEGRPNITIDNSGGARAVVRHLAALGHERIAFVRGPSQNADAEQRLRGYRASVRSAGIEADRNLEIAGNFTEESGYEAVKRILAAGPRPTAIFTANDAMAIGALGALVEAGCAVPDEIALVGFDDIPIARFLAPPLTTVNVPIADLGRRGFELLRASSANPPSAQTLKLETTLVVRQSCGAAQRPPQHERRRRTKSQ